MGICLCGFFGFRRGILGLSSTRDCWCPYSTKGVRETGENRLLIAHQCCGQLTAFKTGYPLTSITWLYRGLKCRPIEVEYFFEVIRWQIISFKWSQAQLYFFQWFIWNMLCLCHYGPALSRFWFQTDLGRENSATFLKIKAGKTFSYHGHALVTLYVQFLYSDWSKFDRWVHAENLCSILKVVYFDSKSWQSFCVNLWCF